MRLPWAEVELVFDEIKEKTVEYFCNLYPGANPDLCLSRLQMNAGRDRTVEAFLHAGGFEVPGQHVANAGCLRAVALSFYFALLQRHPGGLGFFVMDDPILSLDDNHREAWSCNVLRPTLAASQAIVATHQKQFLNNCRADFRPGRLVELNSRRRNTQVSWRPGERLDHADHLLRTAWITAPLEMRKYREEVLITLDAYSHTPIFSRKNLKDSLDRYATLTAPHPLAGANQEGIAARLREQKVARVLDPAAHAMTEADVTEPMVVECLREMRQLDAIVRRELDRLDDARLKELRGKSISGTPAAPVAEQVGPPAGPIIIPFDQLRIGDDLASWADSLRLRVIGTAAAQTHGCVVDVAGDEQAGLFPAGGAVLVATDGLCPAMRAGQWALLAAPDEPVSDGDYAAVLDQSGNHYLRRIWSSGDAWLLDTINPVARLQPVRVRKCVCAVRRVLGVSFGPKKAPKAGTAKRINEWHTRQDFKPSALAACMGITISGSSLEPIAADGHVVMVSGKLNPGFDSLRAGSLAVVETEDADVGNVIKRIHPAGDTWTLLSPNPIDPRDPITVFAGDLRGIWPVQGVLFDLIILDRDIE